MTPDERFVESYRDMARRSVATHRTQWWKTEKGVGEKTARKMLRADLESYRYAKRMTAAKGDREKERDLRFNFKWKWNK